ncbi:MAG TPA: serine hydrolase domain-containing protein [Ilumatobacteraceae bacterium]|nr:serine hydrolase domain-containing protein [Ilumatobacteraceae bacterium]
MWFRLFAALLLGLVAACGGASEPAASPTASPVESSGTEPTPPEPTPPEPTAEMTPVTGTSDAGDLERTLAGKLREYPAPGALALIVVGDERVAGWSGTADLDGTPITPDTRFRIASITKPITAALVLDAVQRGELSLDDRVNDLVPGLLAEEPPVTVRMLLDHTSGIFDATNNRGIIDDVALLTDPAQIAEANELLAAYTAGEPVLVPDSLLVALAEAHGRDFPAGTDYLYGGVNSQVAAIVLAEVTGQPIAELLRERIVEPLGLEHTTLAPPDLASPEFRGYGTDIDDGSVVDATDDLTLFGNGASGGAVSTADELATMMQAIVGGDLLSPELRAEMRTPTDLSEGWYGLGLGTYRLTCGTFYGHEGAVNGTASIALVSEDGANAVVVALNLRTGTEPRMPALADDLLCPALQPSR